MDIATVDNWTRQGIFSADIAAVVDDIARKWQSIRRLPCPQKCHTASIKYEQLRILKIATRFITYVPKPTKEKHISKSLCKSTLKDFSTSNNNQPIQRNPMPVKIPAMESDSFIQGVNRNDRLIVQGTTYTLHLSLLNINAD